MVQSNCINILLIEDNPGDARLIQEILSEAGSEFRLERVDRLSAGLSRLALGGIDLTLLDLSLPDSHGLDTFGRLRREAPDVPAIILTGLSDEALAFEAVQTGAQDYLVKGQFEPFSLERAIRYGLERHRLLLNLKQRTADLLRSETHLQNVIENNADAVLIVDQKGIIRFLNPAAETLFDYGIDHVGMPFGFSVEPGKKTEIALKRASSDHETVIVEMHVVEIEWNGAPAYLASLRDITSHKLMAATLRESEERFRQVMSSITDHIYATEITKDGERLNLYVSPPEALTGYSQEEILADWSFWSSSIIYPEDRATAAAHMARLLQGYSGETEYRLVRADGRIIWVRDSARIEQRGDSKYVYGVVSDITERKEAQEALEAERATLAQRVEERTRDLKLANTELARAARLKDEFLANMSHELRTPLNAILGMSEVLRTQVYGSLNQEQAKAIGHIEEGGRHLLALINDILDLSKIEAGKLKVNLGPVDVDQVCQASLLFIRQPGQKKKIKVGYTFDDKVTTVQADQRRLKQILVNLLSNAVKFTPEGGQIGLDVVGDPEQQQLQLTVRDTGIGIAPEDMDRLFLPFVQIDSKLSRQHEGTGLGLSLVCRFTEMQGGTVSVESEVGRGSRFTVSLPWPAAAEEEALREQSAPYPAQSGEERSVDIAPPAQRRSILLAEDNEANIATVLAYLEAQPYQVILARNGDEALVKARQERPSLILMDIQMPVMDGLQAIRCIRADKELAATPIIALSALAMPGDRRRCLEAGADDYLSKPVSMVRLLQAIAAQLTAEREPDQA